MFRRILKKILYTFLFLLIIALIFLIYFNWPVEDRKIKADMGVTFSYRYAGEIGLDWQEAYLAILDDLEVERIRIPVYWDSVEEKKDQYDFSNVDWQLREAEKRGVDVILVIGQKVPRWPECFVPSWIGNENERKKELLEFVEKNVLRYSDWEVVKFWQIENEPFLSFGVCPRLDKNLLDREIEIAKLFGEKKKIIITDSGELSLWINAAKRADIFGTTMYREVVSEKWGRWNYPIGPRFFHFKKWLMEKFTKPNKSIVIELQAEPWISGWTTSFPLSEQFSSMNEFKLRDNIQFAKNSGFSEIYLWGVEWWYWLKTEKKYSGLWQEAKNEFKNNR